jgi:23S rRNA pseudouridine1911/1915/1917 synthase
MRLTVLYEDNHMLAVSKPAGLLTQGDRSDDPSLLDITKAWLKDKYKKPGNVFLGLVHRLDRQVPGVVVFAKTSKAASRLSAAFRERRVEKIYLAVTEGTPKERQGTLEHRLGPLQKGRVHVTRDGKVARLRYEVVAEAAGRAVVSVRPETGRKHQIRVQLSSIGCPIVNDVRYGAKPVGDAPSQGIALAARRLVVPHPTQMDVRVTIEDDRMKDYLSGFFPNLQLE